MRFREKGAPKGCAKPPARRARRVEAWRRCEGGGGVLPLIQRGTVVFLNKLLIRKTKENYPGCLSEKPHVIDRFYTCLYALCNRLGLIWGGDQLQHS